MKKLTTSVLAVVLTSSFGLVSAQQGQDTLNTQDIEEVIVTGALGIRRTADAVTSAQQIVSSETLTEGKNPNIVGALNGKVSGLLITNTNSGVNDANSIQLRGMRSISGNNEALIVIDNVISDATVLATLPPEIIQNINVIKGAQGAALYGADGLNGVIIVNTIRGSKSGLQVQYNGSVEFESVAFVPKRQTRYGQGWYNARDQYENGGWGPAFDGSMTAIGLPMYDYNGDGFISLDGYGWGDDEFNDGDNPAAMVGPYVYGKDYVKDFFQTGITHNNSITLNAGDQNKYAMLNLSHTERDFVIQDDTRKKTSIFFKAGAKINKFSIEGGVNYIRTSTSQTTILYDESDQQDVLYWHLLQAAPGVPITKYAKYPDNAFAWNMYYQNPYWRIKHARGNAISNFININGKLGYEFNDHINVSYTASLRTRNTANEDYRDAFSNALYTGSAAPATSAVGSALFIQQRNWWDYYGDFMVNFDYDLTDNLNFKLNLGHNYQEHRWDIMQNGGANFEVPGIYNMSNVTQPLPASSLSNNHYRNNTQAFFANLDLDYGGYLFLNATARTDKLSVLPEQNRSFFYPSVGVSFVPTKAFDFGESIISHMKISANWTKVGNASSVGTYLVIPGTSLGSGYPFNGNNSYVDVTNPTDPNIEPEFLITKEVNLAVGLFNNRILIDGSIYQADNQNMITSRSLSRPSGWSSQTTNIAKARNRGAELNLSLIPIQTRDFRWEVNVGYSYNEFKVLKVTDDADEIAMVTLGSLFGVFAQAGSVFPTLKASMMARDDQGRIIINPANGNPMITSTLLNVGTGVPKSIYNFSTNISYKGFRLGVIADYRYGSKFFAYIKNGMAFNGTLWESGQLDREQGGFIMPNSVIPDGSGGYIENTTIKTGGSTYNSVNNYYSSQYGSVGENYLTDGQAFKIREVSLSYTLPSSVLGNFGLNEITIGAYARNPFVKFAKNNQNFADPETTYFGNNARGIAYPGQYPSTKVYGFSLDVKF